MKKHDKDELSYTNSQGFGPDPAFTILMAHEEKWVLEKNQNSNAGG
jgi:hypothetical protein